MCVIILFVGGVSSVFAPNFFLYCCLRFVTNLGSGLVILIFTVLAELMAPHNRDRAIMLVGPMYYIGTLYSDVLAPDFATTGRWRVFVALQAVPVVLVLVWALYRLPENPIWLRECGSEIEQRQTDSAVPRFSIRSSTHSPHTSLWEDDSINESKETVKLEAATVSEPARNHHKKTEELEESSSESVFDMLSFLFFGKYAAATTALMLANFFDCAGMGWGTWFVNLGERKGITPTAMSDIKILYGVISIIAPFVAASISPRWLATTTLSYFGMSGQTLFSVLVAASLQGQLGGVDVHIVATFYCCYALCLQLGILALRAVMAATFPAKYRAVGMSTGQVAFQLGGTAATKLIGASTKDVLRVGWILGAASSVAVVASVAATVAVRRARHRDDPPASQRSNSLHVAASEPLLLKT